MYCHCQDANWNVTALVDAADGAVVERYLYHPYGQPTVLGGVRDAAAGTTSDWSGPRTANTFSNEILFCGYRWEPLTGLYHVRNRDEHPSLGRWIQTQKIEELALMAVAFGGCPVMMFYNETKKP